MPLPISQDLRLRIVKAYNNGEGSMEALRKRFNVSKSFVNDMIQLSKRDPHLIGKQNNSRGRQPKIPDENLYFIDNLIENNSDLTLWELCSKYNEEFTSDVANTAILNALKRLNLTRKKKLL